MKQLFFVSVLVFLSFNAPPKLVKTKVSDDITVLIPKGFRPMDDLDFSQRYPSVRKPIAAYTNEAREVDFSVNISATRWRESDTEIAKQFFKSSIFNMFDRVEMLAEGIHDVNGKQFVYFEFTSRIKGNKKELGQEDPVLGYTYIQYLLKGDQTLVFSFNCPQRIREEWQSTAHKMMKGIAVK